jgi:hypothetical protein
MRNPQFSRTLAVHGATLVVAKLHRLARMLPSFLSLRDAGVDFVFPTLSLACKRVCLRYNARR